MAVTTLLMMKRVFNLLSRALQGFIDSIFQLMGVPLVCPDYSQVSKRAKTANISIKTPMHGEIEHLVIDSTGLKVFGEGESKVRQHGADNTDCGENSIWRQTVSYMKLSVAIYLSVEPLTHRLFPR